MSGEQLFEYFGEINDKFIEEAAPKRHILYKLWWGLVAVVAVILLVTCISPTYYDNDPDSTISIEPDEIFDAPNIVSLHGKYYIDSGHWVFCLPDDAMLLGEVNNIHVIVPSMLVEDLDGTRDGYVYISPEDDDIIYFQHKMWDESVDGREKYILLICEKEK